MSEPMREQPTFRAVLCNCDDQVVVRRLLAELVPDDVKAAVVARYNEHARRMNRRRAEVEAAVEAEHAARRAAMEGFTPDAARAKGEGGN